MYLSCPLYLPCPVYLSLPLYLPCPLFLSCFQSSSCSVITTCSVLFTRAYLCTCFLCLFCSPSLCCSLKLCLSVRACTPSLFPPVLFNTTIFLLCSPCAGVRLKRSPVWRGKLGDKLCDDGSRRRISPHIDKTVSRPEQGGGAVHASQG